MSFSHVYAQHFWQFDERGNLKEPKKYLKTRTIILHTEVRVGRRRFDSMITIRKGLFLWRLAFRILIVGNYNIGCSRSFQI